MAANTSPIYSRQGDIQGGDLLITGANDYTGQSTASAVVFASDTVNGGFVQRLRFKAAGGTTNATSARIYYNNGGSRLIGQVAAPATAPTGSASASGGQLSTGTFFARVVVVDGYGGKSATSPENAAAVNVTGPNGSITWNWTVASGAASYRLYVGPTTFGQLSYFTTTTNSLVQTQMVGTRDNITTAVSNNNVFIGELSLPIVAASATAGTIDVDYPLNFALPPGGRILVCLSNTVTGGWVVSAIGGEY